MTRNVRRWILGLTTAVCVVGSSNEAAGQAWYTVLSGANENPSNASAGIGFFNFSLTGDVLTINGSFSGLTGLTSAAHIHCCIAAPGNVGVATTTPSFAGFPLGVVSGAYFKELDLTTASSFSSAFVTANGGTVAGARTTLINGLNNGTSYFNIHTTSFPGGEIRGFITVVPEPSVLALLVVGLAVLAPIARKRAADRPV